MESTTGMLTSAVRSASFAVIIFGMVIWFGGHGTPLRCIARRLSQMTKRYMVKKDMYTIHDQERFLECLIEIHLRSHQ